MSISNTVKTVMPYLKTAGEYVLHKLSSQAVEMNDGTTLEQKVTSLISLINQKLNVSKVINNLLTTEGGFALDARQGKALNDKITKLNGDLSNYSTILTVASVKKSVTCNTYYAVSSVSCAKTGYTPLGVIGWTMDGGVNYAMPRIYLSGTTINFVCVETNKTAWADSPKTFTFYVLYRKN